MTLEPTDRVLAKTLVKILGGFGALSSLPDAENKENLRLNINLMTKGNDELKMAVVRLIMEVNQEWRAELAGLAMPVDQPTSPWDEEVSVGSL